MSLKSYFKVSVFISVVYFSCGFVNIGAFIDIHIENNLAIYRVIVKLQMHGRKDFLWVVTLIDEVFSHLCHRPSVNPVCDSSVVFDSEEYVPAISIEHATNSFK